MMTGLIIGGVDPLQAIKFQLLVVLFIQQRRLCLHSLQRMSYGQFLMLVINSLLESNAQDKVVKYRC